MKHYILMADIVRSSKYDANILMQEFREISNNINSEFKKSFLSPITITLGDEFQSIMNSLKSGIEVIISFEEQILQFKEKFKLRYILNYGEIETPVNPKQAYQMLGEGLSNSREMLENLKKSDKRFLVKNDNDELTKKLNLAFYVYQSFIDNWKERDFKIISAFLKYKDYKLVAKSLEKDTSLIWRREKSLKINAYLASKELLLSLAI
jgi:hypothetical protein